MAGVRALAGATILPICVAAGVSRRPPEDTHLLQMSVNEDPKLLSKHKPLELVISSYCGDHFMWMTRHLDCDEADVYLYSKCDKADETAFTPSELPSCVQVQRLPNLGREGATWMHHLLTHRSRLQASPAGAMMFLQGRVEINSPRELIPLSKQLVQRSVGFAPFGFITCGNKWGCPGSGGACPGGLLKGLVRFIDGGQDETMQNWVTGVKGQFFLSRARAARVPEWVYDYSLQLLLADPSGSKSNFGHAFERVWNRMFGCWDIYQNDDNPNREVPVCLDHCENEDAMCGPNKRVAREGELVPPPGGQRQWLDEMRAAANVSHSGLPHCGRAPIMNIRDAAVFSRKSHWARAEALLAGPDRRVEALEALKPLMSIMQVQQ